MYLGALVFEHYVNETCPYNIGGEDVCIKVVIKRDDYINTTIINNYNDMIDEGINFFVSGFGTNQSNYAASVTEPNGKLIVSSTTTTSYFHEGRRFAFSVYPTTLSMATAAFPHYRIAGVKSVTFIKTLNSPLPTTLEACLGFEDELIKSDIRNFSYVYYGKIIDIFLHLKSLFTFFFLDYNTTLEDAHTNYKMGM